MESISPLGDCTSTPQPQLEEGAPQTINEILVTLEKNLPLALVYYSPTERIELSGHVTRMWMAKVCGLLSSEAAPHAHVQLNLPLHWRTLMWASGALLAGHHISLPHPSPHHQQAPNQAHCPYPPNTHDLHAAARAHHPYAAVISELANSIEHLSSPHPHITRHSADVSVACTIDDLNDEADVQILTPLASLALRWPDDLPPLALDGASDLMSYPDALTATPTQPDTEALALTTQSLRDIPSPQPDHRILSQADLAQVLHHTANDLTGNPAHHASPVVIDGRTLSPTAGVLLTWAAWTAGRSVVILSQDCDQATAQSAINQEQCVITP